MTDESYNKNDRIPIGTPIYSSPYGSGGMVMIPVDKKERIELIIENIERGVKH